MAFQVPGTDPLKIPKPQAGREYRWLADDRDRMSEHLLSHGNRPGFKLCRGKNVPETRKICTDLGLPETYVEAGTNMIKYGRLVLADIPAVEGKRRRRDLKQMALDLQENQIEDFNAKFAGKRGVRAAVHEMEEFEDRKRFAEEKEVHVSLAGLDIPSST